MGNLLNTSCLLAQVDAGPRSVAGWMVGSLGWTGILVFLSAVVIFSGVMTSGAVIASAT
jgi:hypothetical protein